MPSRSKELHGKDISPGKLTFSNLYVLVVACFLACTLSFMQQRLNNGFVYKVSSILGQDSRSWYNSVRRKSPNSQHASVVSDWRTDTWVACSLFWYLQICLINRHLAFKTLCICFSGPSGWSVLSLLQYQFTEGSEHWKVNRDDETLYSPFVETC